LLDEIGNLPLHLQAKLLSVIQNRVIIPVGSNKEHPIDIRLICSTNKDLQQMVLKQNFRQDLLYRINTIHIELPPLRQRLEDIEVLVNFFTNKYGQKYKKTQIKIQPQIIDKLKSYPWPGNIRELQHTIEKAIILCEGDSITTQDLYLNQTQDIFLNETLTLEDMEKKMIMQELKKQKQSLSLVAKNLGISRPTLYKKMEKYGL
jgi:transcriptional regulator with PAS, ATPase and Fis domain